MKSDYSLLLLVNIMCLSQTKKQKNPWSGKPSTRVLFTYYAAFEDYINYLDK